MRQYEDLIESLDAFIRKYYANHLLRGVLVLLICVIGYILMVSVGEYYLYLPVWARLLLIGLFLLLGAAALLFWVVKPLLGMARLGKTISHEQAAAIIGAHFPEVSDQLLNILQLRQQEATSASRELIEASIGQKIRNISVVPFTGAIDFSRNRRYLPYLLPLLLAMVFILVAAPNVFRDASERLLQPTRTFEKPAPFSFELSSGTLGVVRNSDYTLEVTVRGQLLPETLSLVVGEDQIPMQPADGHRFRYTFRNVTEPVHFRLYGSGFYSKTYELKVLQRPVLNRVEVKLSYPAYTGRRNETRNGISDLVLPAGTNVSWLLSAHHTDKAWLQLGDSGAAFVLPQLADVFAFQYRFLHDTVYALVLENKSSKVTERYSYRVQVIPDQYPVIQVQEFRDTVSGKQVVLSGTAGDDYGISRLLFHYQVKDAARKLVAAKTVPLPVAGGMMTGFRHYFDIEPLGLKPGQELSYYIEAWDNDGVQGSKATRTELMTFHMYDAAQLDSVISKQTQQISSGLSNSARRNEEIQQEMKELQTKMLQSDQMDWQQKQSLQQLARLQEQLKQNLDQVKKQFEEQVRQSEQKAHSEDFKEKQDALKEQLDNLMNKELQEQMKKLQELLKRLNKEQSVQELQQLQEQNKLFSMDMERMQELMKKLEQQMRMEDLAAKLEQLADKQSELRKETDEAKKDSKELSREQQQLKKELDNALKKDMNELQQLGKTLPQQQDLKQEQQQGEQAADQMQQSEQQLEQGQQGKSSQSQSKAAQNLENMAKSLRQKAGGAELEQIEMDIRAVRQILTNLVRLSFDQEQLMKKVQATATSSPDYLDIMGRQGGLHTNARLIRDSLFSLSKRLFKLAPAINKETVELEKYMASTLSALEQRRVPDAATRQQYVMTHTNNLALMLNEVLSNLMEAQSKAKKSGSQGQCNNPGGKTPKPGPGKQLSDIISKQKGMGQPMQQGKDGRKPGQQPGQEPGKGQQEGGKQAGGKQSGGGDGNAEELVRMAQEQAAIRRQLQELSSRLNSMGLGNAKELKEIQDQMDRNETDLVNKRLDGSFLLRQKEIMSRLLEAERSLREQEQDDKRTSKAPEELSRPVPPELQPYLRDPASQLDMYRTVPPALKPYYRQLIDIYFKQINGN